MDRYILFHGQDFYPLGGMSDFKESSENLDDLLLFISKLEYTEWAHIYDLKEKQIIFETQNLSDTIFQCNFQWVNKEESDGI